VLGCDNPFAGDNRAQGRHDLVAARKDFGIRRWHFQHVGSLYPIGRKN
jgi:hypothetical protein